MSFNQMLLSMVACMDFCLLSGVWHWLCPSITRKWFIPPAIFEGFNTYLPEWSWWELFTKFCILPSNLKNLGEGSLVEHEIFLSNQIYWIQANCLVLVTFKYCFWATCLCPCELCNCKRPCKLAGRIIRSPFRSIYSSVSWSIAYHCLMSMYSLRLYDVCK